MKLVGALLGGFHTVLGISVSDAKQGCPCQEGSVPPQSLIETASHNLHRLSSVEIRQEHQGSGGLSLPELHERYGSVELSEEQRHRALVLANSSLDCLDDRVDQPVLATPGGELGEFALALAAYMQEKDSHNSPNQEVVDSLFANYSTWRQFRFLGGSAFAQTRRPCNELLLIFLLGTWIYRHRASI